MVEFLCFTLTIWILYLLTRIVRVITDIATLLSPELGKHPHIIGWNAFQSKLLKIFEFGLLHVATLSSLMYLFRVISEWGDAALGEYFFYLGGILLHIMMHNRY